MQYNIICSKTGDDNNNMRNPSLLLLWGYARYYCCMPSSPVLLHIYCPHPLSCCIYTPLVSLLFGTVIPTSFNRNVFTLFILIRHALWASGSVHVNAKLELMYNITVHVHGLVMFAHSAPEARGSICSRTKLYTGPNTVPVTYIYKYKIFS